MQYLLPFPLFSMQVSWTEDHETAVTGRRTINFYDEEGTSAIRKVLAVVLSKMLL